MERGNIAHELITRGWTQGQRKDPTTGEVCLAGAMFCAVKGEVYGMIPDIQPEIQAVSQAIGFLRNRDICSTYGDITFWNDTRGRTYDEVLTVAKHADEILGRNE